MTGYTSHIKARNLRSDLRLMTQLKVVEKTNVHAEYDSLVEGLKNSDRRAQEAFYKEFYGQMMPTALRYSKSREDANEIINTAFLKVINSISNYKSQNFGGWVRTIVQRTAIDHCRKYVKEGVQTVEILEIDEKTYNQALSNLQVEEILLLFQKLPDSTRTVFNLFVMEELKHDEIAEKLGISKGTSKWHVANARKLLMDLIKEHYG